MVVQNGASTEREKLIKSRERVADHGEVFTPAWLVNDMLDLVKDETERIDSRFLEPACGDGNFLVPIVERKLTVVRRRYGKSDFECRNFALLALMSIYGIELLPDNAADCRRNLLRVFANFLKLPDGDALARSARHVLDVNIVNGDALTMTTNAGKDIVFAEWAYLGRGKFQRRDFRFSALAGRSALSASSAGTDSLFADLSDDAVFTPVRSYPTMTMDDIASIHEQADGAGVADLEEDQREDTREYIA